LGRHCCRINSHFVVRDVELDTLKDWLDILSKFLGILVVLAGVFVAPYIKNLNKSIDRVDKKANAAHDKIGKHENGCGERYEKMADEFKEVRKDVGIVSNDVAEIKGLLKGQRQ
jgi:hypothetical protein